MATSSASDKQTEIKEGIVLKAWTDTSYAAELINDPVDTCQKAGLIIDQKVLDQQQRGERVKINLPKAPDNFPEMSKTMRETEVARTVAANPEMF